VYVPLPSYAVQYLSVSQAQNWFSRATQFVAAHIKFAPAQVKAIEAASGETTSRGQKFGAQ